MAKGIFITATGTDVGKTYVSGLLVKRLRKEGLNCGYYKPVLSGAIIKNDKIIAGDAEHVFKRAGLVGNSIEKVSYVFMPAVSPHLAAKMANQQISLNKLCEDYKKITEENEFTVVEGAGGIICPLDLDKNLFMYDLPKAFGLDCIVIADGGLGTINYTFLTIDFMKRLGLNVKGIILNNFDNSSPMHRDNLEVVEKLCGIKVLGTVGKSAEEIEFREDGLKEIYE